MLMKNWLTTQSRWRLLLMTISLSLISVFTWSIIRKPKLEVDSVGGLTVLPPKMEIVRENLDDSPNIQTRFRLINRGPRTVHIESVRSTCGCTVAGEPSKLILKPREEASLDVGATLPRFGEKHATVTLTIFDGKQEAIAIPIILRGVEPQPPYVEQLPDTLELRSDGQNMAIRREFEVITVEADTDEPWITGFDSSIPSVHTEIIDSIKQRPRGQAISRRYSVLLTTNAKAGSDEPLHGWLSVIGQTPSTTKTERIFVTIESKAALHVSPSRVFFSKADVADGNTERNIVLTHDSSDEAEFEVVSADETWLSAEVVSNPQKKVFQLKVRVTPPDEEKIQEALMKSELRIQVRGNEASLIRLPVTMQLRSS